MRRMMTDLTYSGRSHAKYVDLNCVYVGDFQPNDFPADLRCRADVSCLVSKKCLLPEENPTTYPKSGSDAGPSGGPNMVESRENPQMVETLVGDLCRPIARSINRIEDVFRTRSRERNHKTDQKPINSPHKARMLFNSRGGRLFQNAKNH